MSEAVTEILREIKARGAATTVEQRRAAFKFLCSFSGPAKPIAFESARVPTRDRSSVEVRIYGKASRALVWFHGGGYVCGDVETHHAAMSQLASLSNDVCLVSVGYRLGPEFRFPTALHDALDALIYVRATLEPSKLIVGGDSAGGNLAAALSLHGAKSDAQILCYPTLDATFGAESWELVPVKDIANKEDSLKFDELYARSETDFRDPLFSPLFASDVHGQPKTSVFVGECDPARGDGEAYALKLRAAGVEATTRVFDGMVHGFLTMAGRLDGSRDLQRAIIDAALQA